MPPLVAIVGRPNVGKSSLFNALARRRLAIVEPTPGVTRDRLFTEVTHEGRKFVIADTGGMGIVDRPDLAGSVEDQIARAIEEAEALIFLLDLREGMTPVDEKIAGVLRAAQKPVIVAANKSDTHDQDANAVDFYRLGLGDPLPVSAEQRRNLDDLMDLVAAAVPEKEAEEAPVPAMKIAVLGRRNAGKSTLINALAGGPRVIVSEIPGTTRDSVDVLIRRGDETFLVIDTAGMRKRSSVQNSIDFYSQARAEKSLRRCDVALLLVDATVPVGEVEKKLADAIVKNYKACAICVNKWDLVPEEATIESYEEYIHKTLPGLRFAPLSFLSAKDSLNVEETLGLAKDLFGQMQQRVTTSEINRALRAAVQQRSPSPKSGKIARFYFGSQVGVNPPSIVLFANDQRLISADYLRYLANRFREEFPFGEVPLKLMVRGRVQKEAKETEPQTRKRGNKSEA